MADIEIRLENATGPRGRYVAGLPGGAEAELTFQRAGNVLIADHTGVPAQFEGRGVAAALVDRLIADARAGDLKIAPHCSYVAAQFRRHPDWADLLA